MTRFNYQNPTDLVDDFFVKSANPQPDLIDNFVSERNKQPVDAIDQFFVDQNDPSVSPISAITQSFSSYAQMREKYPSLSSEDIVSTLAAADSSGKIGAAEMARREDWTKLVPGRELAEQASLFSALARLQDPKSDETYYKHDPEAFQKAFAESPIPIEVGMSEMPLFTKYSRANDIKQLEDFIVNIEKSDLEEEIRGVTVGGKIVAGTAATIPYMIDYILTKGAGSGIRAPIIESAKRLAAKYATKTAAKLAVEQGGKALGAVAAAPVTSALMPGTYKAAMRDMLNNVDVVDGHIQIAEEGLNVAESLLTEWAGNAVENLSEESGRVLLKGLGWAGKKIGGKQVVEGFSKLYSRVYPDSKKKQAISAMFDTIGIQGLPEEWLEERFSGALRSALGLPGGGVLPASAEDALAELGVLAVPTLGRAGLMATLGRSKTSSLTPQQNIEALENTRRLIYNSPEISDERKELAYIDLDKRIGEIQATIPQSVNPFDTDTYSEPSALPAGLILPEPHPISYDPADEITPVDRAALFTPPQNIPSPTVPTDVLVDQLEYGRQMVRDSGMPDADKEKAYVEIDQKIAALQPPVIQQEERPSALPESPAGGKDGSFRIGWEEARQKYGVSKLSGLGKQEIQAEEVSNLFKKADEKQTVSGVIAIDMANFKAINDELGHAKGDQALQVIGKAIRTASRASRGDVTGFHPGGDEFNIILSNIKDENTADAATMRIQNAINTALDKAGLSAVKDYPIFAAAGVELRHPNDTRSFEEIHKAAETKGEARKAEMKAARGGRYARGGRTVTSAMTHRESVKKEVGQTAEIPEPLRPKVFPGPYRPDASREKPPTVSSEDTELLEAARKVKPANPVGAALTADDYYSYVLGTKFLTNSMEIGRQDFDWEYRQVAQQIDTMIQLLHKTSGTTRKERREYRKNGTPTNAMRRMADAINTYETPPATMSTNEKSVFNYFRTLSRSLWERENKVRGNLGMDTIPYRTNYYRHVADKVAESIMRGEHDLPEQIKYYLSRSVPDRVSNPTEKSRNPESMLDDLYSRDLAAVTKSMAYLALREVHLNKPLAVYHVNMKMVESVIPVSTRKWVEGFVKNRILDQPTDLDAAMDAWFTRNPLGRGLRHVLRKFGRDLGDRGWTKIMNATSRATIAGALWGRTKIAIRNLVQQIHDLGLYGIGANLKAYLPASPQMKQWIDESRLMRGYVGMEYVGSGGVSALERIGLLPYQWTSEYNISHAMKAAYWDTLELFVDPRYQTLGNSDPKRTYTEPKGFLYPSEIAKMKLELECGPAATQFNYIGMAMPGIFRHKSLSPLTRLQSWWMNYFTRYCREMAIRGFTGKAESGLNLPWSRRLGALRYIIIGGSLLKFLGYEDSFLFGTLPSRLAPIPQFCMALYDWVKSDDPRVTKLAENTIKRTLPVLIPGGLAAQEWWNIWTGKKGIESLVTYSKKKPQEKKDVVTW